MAAHGGFELDSPPTDGVSSLRFAMHADLLLVASWDSHVRLYDATLNALRVSFRQRAPVLDAAFMVRGGAFETTKQRGARRDAHARAARAFRTRTPPSAAGWTPPCGCTTSTARWRTCVGGAAVACVP